MLHRRRMANHTTSCKATAHILIIDGAQLLQRFLQVSLQEAGYIVSVAGDGQEALSIFQAVAIDLVLLDIDMPGMDGNAFCSELRKHSEVPIIILSALCRPEDILLGFHAGADDYITKPFQLREVEVRIEKLLQRSRLKVS